MFVAAIVIVVIVFALAVLAPEIVAAVIVVVAAVALLATAVVIVIVFVLALAVLAAELIAAIVVVVATVALFAAPCGINFGESTTAACNRYRSSNDAGKQQFDRVAPRRSGKLSRPCVKLAPLHVFPPLCSGRIDATVIPSGPTPRCRFARLTHTVPGFLPGEAKATDCTSRRCALALSAPSRARTRPTPTRLAVAATPS